MASRGLLLRRSLDGQRPSEAGRSPADGNLGLPMVRLCRQPGHGVRAVHDLLQRRVPSERRGGRMMAESLVFKAACTENGSDS